MPAIQTTYGSAIAPGFPGQIANGETSNRKSRSVEDAAGIAFGKPAFRGATDHGITATPAAGAFEGIVIANHGQQVVPGGLAADIVPQRGSAGVLDEGVIWVTAGSNTTKGAAVYVTSAGVFTATSTSNTAIPATFDDTVTSGSLVRLRVVR